MRRMRHVDAFKPCVMLKRGLQLRDALEIVQFGIVAQPTVLETCTLQVDQRIIPKNVRMRITKVAAADVWPQIR